MRRLSPPVLMNFHFIDPEVEVTAKVTLLRNPKTEDDIACLEITGSKPNGVKPRRIITSRNLFKHEFSTYGFPPGYPGKWASGIVRRRVGRKKLQIEDFKVPGAPVKRGFSGAPVWDEQLKGVVGMVSEEDTAEEEKIAFIIPCDVIAQACPELKIDVIGVASEKGEGGLLPDSTRITKLNLDERLLDEIYEETRAEAEGVFHDAELSYFSIHVSPFYFPNERVYIDFIFYSKWAGKTCTFSWQESKQKVIHLTPDRRAGEADRHVFSVLPWKENSQWMQILDRIYDKIEPLSAGNTSYYTISSSRAVLDKEKRWLFEFYDGFSLKTHSFSWDGKGLDEKSIKSQDELADDEYVEEVKDNVLPDNTKITKLNMDNIFFDGLYEQALNQAKAIYDDVQLSDFAIFVSPYRNVGYRVSISFDFYSKWADKTCVFSWSELTPNWFHHKPDMLAESDSVRRVYTSLPWNDNPLWMQALNKIYARIGPLPAVKETYYYLSSSPPKYKKSEWHFGFFDGLIGKAHNFSWDGKGLDEESIKSQDELDEAYVNELMFLPDRTKITDLKIDEKILDDIYQKILRKSEEIYSDAKFSDFSIRVAPFGIGHITLSFEFYSKSASKTCHFDFSDGSTDEAIYHLKPDRPAKRDWQTAVFQTLPWKASPHWLKALQRIYKKIEPLPPESATFYGILASPYFGWSFTFFDGKSGEEYRYNWDGKGLDEKNIKKKDYP